LLIARLEPCFYLDVAGRYAERGAGNFLWGMVLNYYGSLLSPNKIAELGTRIASKRHDERWEQKAITSGRSFGLHLYNSLNEDSKNVILRIRLEMRGD